MANSFLSNPYIQAALAQGRVPSAAAPPSLPGGPPSLPGGPPPLPGGPPPMPGGMPPMPGGMPPTMMPRAGGMSLGPTHAMLTQLLQAALLQSAQQPGQMAGLIQNPNQAKMLGGLVGTPYTPPMPQYHRLDYTPNLGPNGLLTNTGWGGLLSGATAGGTSGSGFFGGGGF